MVNTVALLTYSFQPLDVNLQLAACAFPRFFLPCPTCVRSIACSLTGWPVNVQMAWARKRRRRRWHCQLFMFGQYWWFKKFRHVRTLDTVYEHDTVLCTVYYIWCTPVYSAALVHNLMLSHLHKTSSCWCCIHFQHVAAYLFRHFSLFFIWQFCPCFELCSCISPLQGFICSIICLVGVCFWAYAQWRSLGQHDDVQGVHWDPWRWPSPCIQ